MHVLPRVREIEERFADSLTGIGVHAGKFITERKTERIASACDRLAVEHAVVNDRQFRIWRDYAVEAWPTVALVDPEGYLALVSPGEFDVDTLSAEIERVIASAEERGTLVRGPDPVAVAHEHHEGFLRFPARAILAGERLWVSDTGHGRVLECAWRPAEKTASVVVEHAGFVEPRGLAAIDGRVSVADRRGHTVWRLVGGASGSAAGGAEGGPGNGRGGDRERVAGTGALGHRSLRFGSALEADLRSPWGLAASDGRLVIAMAGAHQLWSLDSDAGTLARLAGTGAEELKDGPAGFSAMAQPTGVAALEEHAVVSADCESSAVRMVRDEAVSTLVGTGLFEFGDRTGVGDSALLQHCEDVAVHGNALAVADTYNDRLKRVDPATRACDAWPGEAGEAGSLREPGGVWSDGETLLVADTGHHRIVAVEPDGSLAEVCFDVEA